jgi:P27 family predicted phage terminase small subunit
VAAPKPRPTTLKVLEGRGHGRDSGGRAIKPSPAFRRLPPEPPAILEGEALAEWNRIVPELQRLGLTKPLDAASLAAYCLCWQRLVEAQKLVNVEGVLGQNSQGRVRHPAVAVVEAASKELRGWAAEFGLTPSSEQGLGQREAPNGEGDNPFGETG